MDYVSRETEFTVLIGRGLSAFGQIEMSLAALFRTAVRAADPKTAEKVFWAVNSYEVRIAMTAAAIKSAYPLLERHSELPSLWAEIAGALPIAGSLRNELAHGSWQGMAWLTKRGMKHDQYFAPYIGKATAEAQPFGTITKGDPRPKKRLYEADLEKRIRTFLAFKCVSTTFAQGCRSNSLKQTRANNTKPFVGSVKIFLNPSGFHQKGDGSVDHSG